MKKILIGAGVAAALSIGGSIAVAQDMKRGADANSDGAISRAELDQALETRFARLDADRDGRITQDERKQMRAGGMEQRAERRFERLDTDKNGSISRAEFDAAMEQRTARRGPGGPGDAGRGGKGAMVDTDNDGAISKQEFTSRAVERFEASDANSDGQVTREERRAGREERRGR